MELSNVIDRLKKFHFDIINELFIDNNSPFLEISGIFEKLENRVYDIPPSLDYDFEYDQIVSYGELISSKIAVFIFIKLVFNTPGLISGNV